MAAVRGSLYFMFLGPLSKVSGYATETLFLCYFRYFQNVELNVYILCWILLHFAEYLCYFENGCTCFKNK